MTILGMKELGEVAEAIRKEKGNKNRTKTQTDLGSEVADLVISIVTLANHFDVDINKEISKFQKRLASRHKI